VILAPISGFGWQWNKQNHTILPKLNFRRSVTPLYRGLLLLFLSLIPTKNKQRYENTLFDTFPIRIG
jgi:hypothetical protein